MRSSASLTNRVFLACTLLAVLSLGFAFYFVNERVASEAEADLRRGLTEARTLVDEHRTTLTDTFTRLARLVADLPKLKAAMATLDPPTVQPLADEYRQQVNADLVILIDPRGQVLGSAGADISVLPLSVRDARGEGEVSTFWPHQRGVLQMVSVPVFVGGELPEILGRLTVGFFLDDRLAQQFKTLTGSEIAFGAQGRILASTLPAAARPQLAQVMGSAAMASVTIGDEEFLALAQPLLPATSDAGTAIGAPETRAPVALILRSRTERMRLLNTIRTGLAGVLVVTVLLATIFSYAVARTMTRPLAAITTAMRDVADTGDLTRKVTLRSRPWDDEDARVLAGTFNALTESVARFQRDAAQKERLSSLGRLSTVIAHEIRNPLMIIKAALATLRTDAVKPSELREAVADIDGEIARLNRIVTEVLDFARPIRFDMAEAGLNDICRASAAAAWAGDPHPRVRLELDDDIPGVVTDAERLRTALVNILANARHAVQASPRPDPVLLRTRRVNGHVTVTIRDRGVGIAAEDMARIFDPYFTTRRAGTGLGLPIAKNIIEGLGGALSISSEPGEGTEISIDLPLVRNSAPGTGHAAGSPA
jgi:signal transduction histidine kinase